MKACVEWNFSQNLIAEGVGQECPSWKTFEKLISGDIY